MKTLLISIAVLACAPAHADPADTEVRPVTGFHGIVVSTVIDVDITLGSTTRVELRGPKAWLAKLETKVEDGVLEIGMPGHNNNPPKLHATITVPSLDSISLSGVGDIVATKLAAPALSVKVSGVGNVTLTGSTDDLDLKVSGVGDVHANELGAKVAHVKLSGTGNAQVRATQEIDAKISGMGDITVIGKPTVVHKHVSGMGKIRID